MASNSNHVHTWTLGCLIGAFFDLAVAYLLLCVSASLFLPLKCLSFFGIYLPCSCDGCLHKLLFDWPVRSIYSVQNSAKNRFPFNLIWLDDHHQACSELEGQGEGCSLFTGSRLQSKQNGYDAKGKKITRTGMIRRRRKAQSGSGYGRSSNVLLLDSRPLVTIGVSGSSCIDFEMSSESSERLDPVSIIEDGPKDDGSATEDLHPSERRRHGFEMEVPTRENKDKDSCDQFSGKAGNIGTKIEMLQQALDEEKALCMSLYLELEKERGAAATAADEAMAMIIRLQEEKASIEMESRQYQRMIEEKSVYDEEEVNILKEILVRREKENHLLEKEVEAYRNMEISENEQSDDGFDESSVTATEMSSKLNQHTPHKCGLPEKTFVLAEEKNNGVECKVTKTEPGKAYILETLSFSGEELDNGGVERRKNEKILQSSILETEPAVYDFHVIDDSTDITLGNPQQKDMLSNSERKSPMVGNENFKVEIEVERLKERVRIMQQEKEKLSLSPEGREKMNSQLQGLMNQLIEIQELGEPEWSTS